MGGRRQSIRQKLKPLPQNSLNALVIMGIHKNNHAHLCLHSQMQSDSLWLSYKNDIIKMKRIGEEIEAVGRRKWKNWTLA